MKKVVAISGGTDGLGKEIAKILTLKYNVVAISPTKEKLEKVSKELKCNFELCDVSNYKNVESTVNNIIDRYKRIDCLINNAGVWIEGELEKNDSFQIKRVIEINTLGTIFLTKAVIPFMKNQGDGIIINIISQAGIYGKAERSIYSASKFAVTGFTKCLSLELTKYGIKVMGIYPGKMKTNMFKKLGIDKDMSDAIDPKEIAKTIEFILSLDEKTVFKAIEINKINY